MRRTLLLAAALASVAACHHHHGNDADPRYLTVGADAIAIAVAQAKTLSRDYAYVEVRRAGVAHPAYRFCDGALAV